MQNQMDQKQMLLMQQAWAESHAQEMMRMRQHEAMNQVYQAEMEKSQAEAWKTDFIENEVLNAKEKELNAVCLFLLELMTYCPFFYGDFFNCVRLLMKRRSRRI